MADRLQAKKIYTTERQTTDSQQKMDRIHMSNRQITETQQKLNIHVAQAQL